MISADFYTTAQTYADGEIERTDIINNLYSNDVVGSPYYLGYIEHDDFPKSFGVSLVDYSQGMAFKRIESNHSWGFCFNKNVYNTTGSSTNLFVVQDANGHAAQFDDRYCFLNKIKMAQQNFDRTITYTAYIMYIPTSSIDETGSAPFDNYATSSINRTVTVEQLKDIIEDTSNVLNAWTSSSVNYPDVKYSDFNEYGLAMIPALDANRTAVICIARVSIAESGRYSYGNSSNVRSAVFPFFEHDTGDKHIITSQGDGYTLSPIIKVYYDLGIIRPSTNFGMEYSGQFYIAQPYPYDINMSDLPMPDNTYRTSVLVKGQYFLKWYSSEAFNRITYNIFAHYDLKDVYTLMLYYHKIYTTSTYSFNKSYDTTVSVATFNDHDGATGERLSDAYATIADQLRDWQQPDTDIAVNEYDPADKPEYDPSGGGGGEPDEGDWGTSIIPFSQTTFGSTSFSRFELLNQAGVNELLGKLWAAPQSFWEGLSINKQLAANLNDYILSLRAYPVALNAGNAHNTIYIGASSGIDIQQGLFTPTLVNRIPLGALRISRQYNNFLDYNPYTSASIYLPFCGTVEINPKYLYDAALYLNLFVDCTDGSGVWTLVREGDDGKSFPILLRQCRVGVDIPITGLDTSQMASNIVNATIQTGQHALQSINKVTGAAAQVGAAVATGGTIGAEGVANLATMGGSIALQGLADATNMAMANKEIPFYTSGSGGAAAAEGNTEPFITLRRPLVSNPSNFAHTVGNLVNKTATISSLNGFTICRNVDVNGIGQATDKEKAQIKQILESGFYA